MKNYLYMYIKHNSLLVFILLSKPLLLLTKSETVMTTIMLRTQSMFPFGSL